MSSSHLGPAPTTFTGNNSPYSCGSGILASDYSINSDFQVQIPQAPGAFVDPSALRALVALMDMEATIGGAASHFGGPSALAEIVSAIYGTMFSISQKTQMPWTQIFNLVNDAGHCENVFYAARALYNSAGINLSSLKGFRSLQSPLTGHGESHLFPKGVLLSNGPLGSAFPQSLGLSLGDRMREKSFGGHNRTTITVISDGACMEGETRETLATLPGFAKKGLLNPYILIISDNNTKLSGRIDQDSFSMAPTFASLTTLGWKVLTLENAHDLNLCVATLKTAHEICTKDPSTPVAIHARTVKGFGVKSTAESSSGGHGFPLKKASELTAFLSEIYGQRELPMTFTTWVADLELREKKMSGATSAPSNIGKIATDKIQAGISSALIAMREKGYPVISVTSDLPGSTGVSGFRKKFPEASFDVGIAESQMISAAAGLSKTGFIPVVDTFAQFGVTKGALPLTMASLSQSPVIGVFSHTGFQDAADGASHQALSYVAVLASIPGVRIVSLSCRDEADALVKEAVEEFHKLKLVGEIPPSTIFFLGRENFPLNYQPSPGPVYTLEKPTLVRLRDGSPKSMKKIVLVASGSLVPELLEAQQILATNGVDSALFHPTTLNPSPDSETYWNEILKHLRESNGHLLVAEDHQVKLGFGSLLAQQLGPKFLGLKAVCCGVQNVFGQSAYTAHDLYHKHGLDGASLAQTALRNLGIL